ncbi:hypothetical protein [Nocardia sp. NBC_00511]|uniref:hypothetical protein n=1 Tax=Nocardia sp. NBC_00511 TaxID=2903591 RepID=UPI0030E5A23E
MRSVVLERRPHEAWAEVAPLVLCGARSGVRVCADDGKVMELLVTAEFVCTPDELAAGAHFAVTRRSAGAPVGEVGRAVGDQRSGVTTVE